MSIKEGLESTDVAKIKAARGTAKGQVTKHCKNLQRDLVQEDNKFLLDEIESEEVQELYQKLNKSYDIFQNLHYRYLVYRYGEENYDEEADDGSFYVDEKENHYSDDVENKVSLARRSYVKYKKALAVSIVESPGPA